MSVDGVLKVGEVEVVSDELEAVGQHRVGHALEKCHRMSTGLKGWSRLVSRKEPTEMKNNMA